MKKLIIVLLGAVAFGPAGFSESKEFKTDVAAKGSTDNVALSSLNLKLMSTGWGSAQAKQSASGNPICIAGKTFQDGVGTHAPSAVKILLGGQGKRFSAWVGVDDGAPQTDSSVVFKVMGDGKVLFDSSIMKRGEQAKMVDVDIAGLEALRLEVTDAGDGKSSDHANWADAVISMTEGVPITMPEGSFITIPLAQTMMVLRVSPQGRIQQAYLGPLSSLSDALSSASPMLPAYPLIESGSEIQYKNEPALHVVHADGSPETRLIYDSHTTTHEEKGSTLTRIALKDPLYPFQVDLCYRAWAADNIIEQWSEIRHQEARPVTLQRYASAAIPLLSNDGFWLTHFHGKWANEFNIYEERLTPGIKTIENKRGIRVSIETPPHFMVSIGGPIEENRGTVLGASLAWSGNIRFDFDMSASSDVSDNQLMIVAGANPFLANYRLDPKKTFETPHLLYTFSTRGKGEVSRRFHRWALKNQLRGGNKTNLTLLNNWEATGFDVSEKRVTDLINNSKDLGLEIFLLDDGWFGDDKKAAVLGDWRVSSKMLPNGLKPLIDASEACDFTFGIWVETEMAAPDSPVAKAHPEWILADLRREHYRDRGAGRQWVLDLSNPEVQKFVFDSLDELLTAHPRIGYVKWDSNSYIHNPYSTHLGSEYQSNLWVDYIHGLYAVMEKIASKHPSVQMMACSSGGGRVDYGVMRYFDEFWPSDNTNARQRMKIQWGFSHFFPAKTISAHVTHWQNNNFKFAFDMAMSGRLGMDVDPSKMTSEELAVAKRAIPLYKTRLRDIVQSGELYRLLSPYKGSRAALSYVMSDKSKAVLFVYQMEDDIRGKTSSVSFMGLDPNREYLVEEVNTETPVCASHGKTVSGKDLMEKGISIALEQSLNSAVILLTMQPEASE